MVGSALAASQLGHLIAFQVHYGSRALALESSGAHAYFPSTLSLATALAGGSLLFCLLVLGTARLVAGRALGLQPAGRWPFVDTLATVFALQLLVFVGQEFIESWAAGQATPNLLTEVLWGAVGQTPVALLLALALTQLSRRLEASVRILRSLPGRPRWQPRPVIRLAIRTRTAPALAHLRAQVSGPSLRKRGPPAGPSR